VARLAFSDRSKVLNDSDKNSKVTQFLLDYLQEKEVANLGIEKRIEYMKQCVKDFSCSPQAEADFWKSHKADR